MYQNLYHRAKKIIKKDACMKFYTTSKPLYLEPDVSCVSLGARLLMVRGSMNCGCEVLDNTTLPPTAFASKSLLSAEEHYSNIECEAPGILHGLEKFHKYCFARDALSLITSHLLEYSAKIWPHCPSSYSTLSFKCRHRVQDYIQARPSPVHCRLAAQEWPYTQDKDQEITGMNVNVNAFSTVVNMPVSTPTEDI